MTRRKSKNKFIRKVKNLFGYGEGETAAHKKETLEFFDDVPFGNESTIICSVKRNRKVIAILEVLGGKNSGKQYLLHDDKRKINIGRQTKGNDFQLDDECVSNYHAVIVVENDIFRLTDIGSLNGTFLNKKKIVGSEILEDGDEIAIGDNKIIFFILEKRKGRRGNFSIPAYLMLVKDQRVVEKYELIKDITLLGRSKKVDIFIDDPDILEKHAIIFKTPKKFVLIDMNSGKGTYINKNRVDMISGLKNNDRITIGKNDFTFKT